MASDLVQEVGALERTWSVSLVGTLPSSGGHRSVVAWQLSFQEGHAP